MKITFETSQAGEDFNRAFTNALMKVFSTHGFKDFRINLDPEVLQDEKRKVPESVTVDLSKVVEDKKLLWRAILLNTVVLDLNHTFNEGASVLEGDDQYFLYDMNYGAGGNYPGEKALADENFALPPELQETIRSNQQKTEEYLHGVFQNYQMKRSWGSHENGQVFYKPLVPVQPEVK